MFYVGNTFDEKANNEKAAIKERSLPFVQYHENRSNT